LCGGRGKVEYKEEQVTEGWKVLCSFMILTAYRIEMVGEIKNKIGWQCSTYSGYRITDRV
jgi:hypothetical protein